VPLIQRGGALVGVIGLRITEPVVGRTLRVRYRDTADRTREATRLLQVKKTPFPVRHLTMRRSTERLYNFPGSEAEDRSVNRAVRTRTPGWQWNGPFRLPAHGRLSTPFGVKRIRNRRTTYYHRGTDIAAPTGRPIIAPERGRVVLSRDFRKYGGTVVLDHGGGVTTLYLHMSARAVKEGQSVAAGELIGKVGATGVATGPHLHWGLYVHGTAVNPLHWTRLPLGFYS
jgi:murein DD-endopeptidase MepM/ murein hydrolase activator NlpD